MIELLMTLVQTGLLVALVVLVVSGKGLEASPIKSSQHDERNPSRRGSGSKARFVRRVF